MQSYGYISIIALFFYGFIFLTFLAAKKEKTPAKTNVAADLKNLLSRPNFIPFDMLPATLKTTVAIKQGSTIEEMTVPIPVESAAIKGLYTPAAETEPSAVIKVKSTGKTHCMSLLMPSTISRTEITMAVMRTERITIIAA